MLTPVSIIDIFYYTIKFLFSSEFGSFATTSEKNFMQLLSLSSLTIQREKIKIYIFLNF